MDEMGKTVQPDKANGVQKLGGVPAQQVPKEITKAGAKILKRLGAWCGKEYPRHKLDPVMLAKVISMCLTQQSAVLAVDAGVNKDSYLKATGIIFDQVYAAAPKFGP